MFAYWDTKQAGVANLRNLLMTAQNFKRLGSRQNINWKIDESLAGIPNHESQRKISSSSNFSYQGMNLQWSPRRLEFV